MPELSQFDTKWHINDSSPPAEVAISHFSLGYSAQPSSSTPVRMNEKTEDGKVGGIILYHMFIFGILTYIGVGAFFLVDHSHLEPIGGSF
jgi:hypothetical protein